MRWRVGGTAVLLAVLLSACGSGHTEKLGPTADGKPLQRITTTTSTTTVDAAGVPASPDVAYAQSVVNQLDAVTGEMVKVFVRDKGPSLAFETYLKALYDGPVYDRVLRDWQEIAAQSMDNIRTNPAAPKTRIRELIGATSTCMFFTADEDLSAMLVKDFGDTGTPFIELLRKKPERDPEARNPTAWAMVADGSNPDGTVPPNPCRTKR